MLSHINANSDDFLQLELAPSLRQKKFLESLFAGPKLIAELLRRSGKAIKWPDEASLFLLQHRNELESYLFERDRNSSIDLLKSLVLQWSNEPPADFGISFSRDCSISGDQKVYFPLERLGLLDFMHAEQWEEVRAYKRRYNKSFDLLTIASKYYVNIYLQPNRIRNLDAQPPIQAQRISQQNHKARPSKPARSRTHSVVFKAENFLAMFNNRVNQALAFQLKVSRQFSTTKFSDLNGRSVQGGLPSLGKRR